MGKEAVMRLVTYEVEHKGGLGVISKDGKWVYPLRSLDMDYKTMQELIEGISESEKTAVGVRIWSGSVQDKGSGTDRGGQISGAGQKSKAGCDLSGHQLHGSCRRICPLQKRGIWWGASLRSLLFQTCK